MRRSEGRRSRTVAREIRAIDAAPSGRSAPPARRGIARWWPALPLVASVALVVHLTLEPFDFTWQPILDALRAPHVEWVPFTYVCKVHGRFCPWDRLDNVLLFVPLGAFAALLPVGAGAWSHRLRWITAAALALSLAIETAQLFLPSRFPSTADVLLNTLGAWLGARSMAALRRRRLRRQDLAAREAGGA